MSKKTYLESLQGRVLIFDGAMGTAVQRYNLTPEEFGGAQFEGCNDYLCVTNPRVIEEIQRLQRRSVERMGQSGQTKVALCRRPIS